MISPKIKVKWLLCALLITSPLFGAEEWDSLRLQTETTPNYNYPFTINGQFLQVSPTRFRESDLSNQKLHYRQNDLTFAYTHPFNAYCGLIFGAGWVGSKVDMEDNPEFNQTTFDYVNFSLSAFTKAFPCWTWTVALAAFLDVEEFSLIDYALYQGILWGRYEVNSQLELDFGVIAEVGLHKEKIWPILGFIYTISPKWKINAVFPVNIALDYTINPCWMASASVRFLRNRHRLQEDEVNSQGIFEYRTTGYEVDLTYSPFPWFSAKGFIGLTTQGDLKITDRNNHHAHHFKFEGAGYIGASAVLSY